jgi:hypothetical protein
VISAARRPVLLIVAITIAVEVFMITTGMGPDVLLVAAVAATLGTAVWLVVDIADSIPTMSPIGSAAPQQFEHRVDRRVTRLRSGLAHGQIDRLSAERLHTSLVAIIDDQLRAEHQIDRHADPTAAAALIGPELTRFIDDPTARLTVPSTGQLDRILTQIERL